jgi:ELWxxDGT repeat protein
MLRSTWLQPLRERLQALWASQKTSRRQARPRCRPQLEFLEVRTVLSPTRLTDLNQLSADSNPHSLVNFQGELYFAANDGIHGNQLWKSNGKAGGTAMVTDINPGTGGQGGLDPGNLTAVGNTLFFSGTDGVHGYELWKSDGTPAGTGMVADLNPGAGGSYPGGLTDFNGTLYFVANDGNTPRLYKSDGTAPGTVAIPGTANGRFEHLTVAGNGLYFATGDPNGVNFFSDLVWRTDGTTVQQLAKAEQPSNFTAVNGAVFYADYLPSRGFEAFRTGTNGAVNFGVYQIMAGVNLGGTFYFSDGISRALYKSDGTAAGTARIASFSTAPLNLLTINNALYFTASDGSGPAVWKSDGTAAGTVRLSGAGGDSPTNPGELTDVNGVLYL